MIEKLLRKGALLEFRVNIKTPYRITAIITLGAFKIEGAEGNTISQALYNLSDTIRDEIVEAHIDNLASIERGGSDE